MTVYEKIFLFNNLIGNKGVRPLSEDFWEQVGNQSDRIVEEAAETYNAVADKDLTELVDGVADVMVVAIGLYQKLQLCGVDVSDALERVCDNNLTKFHDTPEYANETVKFYEEEGVAAFVRLTTMEDGDEFYSVIRESDKKLLKPHDFVGVDLSDIIEMTQQLSEVVEDEPTEE